MSMAPPVASSPATTTAESQVCSNGAPAFECNTSIMSTNIKQEKRDERLKMDKLSPRQQTSNTPIAFSITNILSNNFGNGKLPSTNDHICLNKKINSAKKSSVLFRPYDDDCGDNDKTMSDKPKLDRRQRSDDEESNGKLKNFDERLKLSVANERLILVQCGSV